MQEQYEIQRSSHHEVVLHKCYLCDHQTTKKADLQRHLQSTHEEERVKNRTKLDYDIGNDNALKRNVVTKKKQVVSVCPHCNTEFIKRGYLQLHIRTIHKGIWEKCSMCEHQAIDKSSLKTHVSLKHEGFRFECQECNYQTSWKHSLNKHISS